MPRLGLLLPAVTALALALMAPAGAARANTILRLTETATVAAKPDQIVAQLQASATAATSAEAQQKLNTIMAAAVARAQAVPGLSVRTDAYYVWRMDVTSSGAAGGKWQASQSLMLTAADGPPLLALVDALQQSGLTTNQLSWRLSPEATKTARRQATEIAVKALRTRADEAAQWLGLRFVSFQEVRLDDARPTPMPMYRRGVQPAAMAASPAPPVAEADNVNVSASVEADAVLAPP